MRRALDTHRYGNDLAARVQAIIARLGFDLSRSIPANLTTDPRRERIIRALLQDWRVRSEKSFAEAVDLIHRELPDVVKAFRQAAGRDMGVTVGEGPNTLPTDIDGLKVRQWMDNQRATLLRRGEQNLRLGVGQGESADQIQRRIEQVAQARARESATVAKTAATRAAQAGYAAGLKAAGVERYTWNAVLDDKTCPRCSKLHGQVFSFDDPKAPKPPDHFLCRCYIEPVVETPEPAEKKQPAGMGGELASIAREAGLDVEAVRRAERELIAEGVAVRRGSGRFQQGWARNPQRINTLLREQAASVQRDILGPRGARRFAVGLNLGQVASRETGRLSLDQLRNRLL